MTYCHLWPPPPPPDRWSTKHFSSCSSSPASCRWPSILFASRSPSVQILMNFCSRQLLHAFDQFILSHPLSSHVFNLLHGDHHIPSSNSSNVIHSIANAIAHSPFKWLIPAGEKSLVFQIMFSCLNPQRTKCAPNSFASEHVRYDIQVLPQTRPSADHIYTSKYALI